MNLDHAKRVGVLLLATQLAAFWPVWQWYGLRLRDGSDEPWGILALTVALLIVAWRRRLVLPTSGTLVVCVLLAVCYLLSYPLLPPLLRGVLAILSLSCTLSALGYGRLLQPALAGLLLLSLPVIASLQFFGGFPLRLVTSHVVAFGLGILGWEVQAQGTLLRWAGEMVAVDAPCAGIKMLWSALVLNFALAARFDFGPIKTWLCTSLTLSAVLVGNLLRAMLLFFIESGIVAAPEIAHQLIGLMVFGLVTLAVITISGRMRSEQQCAMA